MADLNIEAQHHVKAAALLGFKDLSRRHFDVFGRQSRVDDDDR